MERYQIAYDELKNYIAKFLKSGEKEHYNSNAEYRKYWDALQNAIFESNNDRVTTVDISGMFLKSLASSMIWSTSSGFLQASKHSQPT